MLDKIDDETGEVTPDDDVQVNDAPDFDPELGTLMGDLRDVMLMRIRNLQKPWQQMTEAQQTDCANGIELGARDIIKKTVRLLNKHDWPHAVVSLGQVTITGDKGIKAQIECANIQHNRDVLGGHVGQQVMVMMVDSDTFMAARAPAKIDKDQPEMPLEAPDDGNLDETSDPDEQAAT